MGGAVLFYQPVQGRCLVLRWFVLRQLEAAFDAFRPYCKAEDVRQVPYDSRVLGVDAILAALGGKPLCALHQNVEVFGFAIDHLDVGLHMNRQVVPGRQLRITVGFWGDITRRPDKGDVALERCSLPELGIASIHMAKQGAIRIAQ
ncbi:hypothetical protein D3C85_1161670 [compost metagenome]